MISVSTDEFSDVSKFLVARVAPPPLQPDVRRGAAGQWVLHRQRDAPRHAAHRKTGRG